MEVNEHYYNSDLVLSEDFKRLFQEAYKGTVQFNKYSAVITTPNGLKVYLPNQGFLIAAIMVRDSPEELKEAHKIIKETIFGNDTNQFNNGVAHSDTTNPSEETKKKDRKKVINNIKDRKEYDLLNEQDKKKVDHLLELYFEKGKALNHTTWINPYTSFELQSESSGMIKTTLKAYYEKPENLPLYKEALKLLNGLKEASKKFNYSKKYSDIVIKSKNIILRGAPGTGKSYLAKEIAADIISEGTTSIFSNLTESQKQQVEFVQFHPSYDYTDFIEGLRPIIKDNEMSFKLQDGIFKKFCKKAISNPPLTLDGFSEYLKENSITNKTHDDYIKNLEFLLGEKQYTGNKWNVEELKTYSSLEEILDNSEEIFEFDRKKNYTRWFISPINNLKEYYESLVVNINKPYIFIIDEINRGEISKIFGELFFSIDPNYRGKIGEVATQYSNLHKNPNEKFYIPKNVYIIGTMNDIDRSVDSFDFAMRRRFRFIEITAESQKNILDGLGTKKEKAVQRMTKLNQAISNESELNENYHIGPSYFLKLESINAEELWRDYLLPLLQDYVRGMYNEKEILEEFEDAYNAIGEIDEVRN